VLDIKNWTFRSIGRYGETKKRPPKQTEHSGILFIVEVKAMFCWGGSITGEKFLCCDTCFWVGKALDFPIQL